MAKKTTLMPPPFHVGVDPTHTVRAVDGPDGDGRFRWRLEWYVQRRQHTAALGWLTRPDAQRAAQLRASSGDATPRSRGTPTLRTMQDLCELWLGEQEARADLEPRSLVAYRLHAEHLAGHLGEIHIAKLDSGDLARYRDARMRESSERRYQTGTVLKLCNGASPRTVFHELLLLSTMWKWARGRGWVDRPLPEWRVRLRDPGPKPVPTEADIAKMVGMLSGWPRLALILCWATGARISEIGTLRRRDVHLQRQTIQVDGKTGARTIPISADVAAELRRWMEMLPDLPDGWLLGVRRSTVSMVASIHWRPVAEALGIETPTGHGARRAVVDRLARAGVDVATGAALLGHSAATQLQYYRQPTQSDMVDAVENARLGMATLTPPAPRRKRFRVSRLTAGLTGTPERSPPKPIQST